MNSGTLKLTPKNKEGFRQTQERRTDERRNQSQKPTHEIILRKIKQQSKPITLTLLSDSKVEGELSQFDKWTITLRVKGNLVTIFKHAIACFSIEEE